MNCVDKMRRLFGIWSKSRYVHSISEFNGAVSSSFRYEQNEKRMLLVESESAKMKQYDAEYEAVVAEWRAELVPRKQVCTSELIDSP